MNDPKQTLRIHTATAYVVLALAVSTGCFDHRRGVAFKTLVNQDGTFDEKAYAAALTAKFPPGSEFEALQRYVFDNGGSCHPIDGAMWCEIPLRGRICWAALAGIKVHSTDGKIESVETKIGSLGC